MLSEMLSREYAEMSYLEIENMLCNEDAGEENSIRDRVVREFFEYACDVLLSLLSREQESLRIGNIILS